MKRHLVLALALMANAGGARAEGPSWVFRPSYYTHGQQDCERVWQFAQEQPALKREDPFYEQSGYRHSRSSLRVGDSYDYQHVVETWGRGDSIRPYGEWEYPYRAGATPYGPWGNPQGPWTTPFGAWSNPYGLGQLPIPPWMPWFPPRTVPPAAPVPPAP